MDEPAEFETEVMDLLSALWDGRLDKSARDRLEKLLSRDDSSGVRVLTEFTRVHLDLELLVSSATAQRKALHTIAKTRAGDAAARRRVWTTPGLYRLGAAALFLFVAGLLFVGVRGWRGFFGGDDSVAAPMVRPAVLVGRLVGGPQVQWGEDSNLRDGQNLYEGQVIDLVAGSARVSMAVGAELALQAPCRATLTSSNLVVLDRGLVAVKVAKWAVGFQVRTSDMLVTDMGTKFTVQATPQAGTEVHVLEGLVVATALRSPALTRNLAAAQAVRATTGAGMDSIAFKDDILANVLDSAAPLRLLALPNTGVNLQEGDPDPRWTVTSGDPQFGPYPRPALVSAATPVFGANDAARSQWISVPAGTTGGVPVRTKYVFESTVDLSGFDLSSVRLAALVLADNGVEEIRLNGRPLPIAPWLDWYAGVTFFNFHAIEIVGGFVPGKNIISFVVVNGTDLPAESEDKDLPDVPNPMALRVEWQGFGRPL